MAFVDTASAAEKLLFEELVVVKTATDLGALAPSTFAFESLEI